MKSIIKATIYTLLIAIMAIASCKKTDQVFPPPLTQSPGPVANAGKDQTITWPADSVILDGSASAGVINNYQWRKISGPGSSLIQNASAVKTNVKNLEQGVYLFELKVTDSTGFSSTDIVQVTVSLPPPSQNVNLKLIPFGTLSQARHSILTATAGSKILFVGGRYLIRNCFYDSSDNGWWNCEYSSTRVDIYDTSTLSWSTADLDGSRYSSWNSAVVVGDKIFLAGGYGEYAANSSRVDIYDASANSWSFIHLPAVIRGMAVASLGNKVFFAGWNNGPGPGGGARVDIYDNSTNSWSIVSLSVGRLGIAATSVGNKILFAGGHGGGGYSNTVDIYDASTNTWSVSALSLARMHPKAITLGSRAFFAGGDAGNASSHYPRVDIYDNNTQNWSSANLPFGNSFLNAASMHNKVLFFRMPDEVSIYDNVSNSWSIGKLNKRTYNPGVITVGNQIYVAGGNPDDGINDQTNQVWKLEF